MEFQEPNTDILEKWEVCADIIGIPKSAYHPEVKIIKGGSGKSGFTFGAILNNYRESRPQNDNEREGCILCEVVQDVKKDSRKNLDLENKLPGFVVTANKFAICEGFSIAIANPEKPVHTTKNLSGLEKEMERIFAYADYSGFKVFHNGVGAGASISEHEHWQLTNFAHVFNLAGEWYGFEVADYIPTNKDKHVQIMPGFNFAHLIFNKKDPDKITDFLKKLHEGIKNNFQEDAILYVMCQSKRGILVVPSKKYGRVGAGEPAGHFVCKTQKEFDNINYDDCVAKLKETRFLKKEINLEKFL